METVQATRRKPSLAYRLKSWAGDARRWVQNKLFRAAMALNDDGELIAHAKRELAAVGYDPAQKENDPNKWIQQNLLDLLRVMSMQGHSGFSASYLVTSGDGMYQNARCGTVFKQPDRFDGQAYDIDARVFREPDGNCFTNRDSMVPITFPYTPKREYVDVPARD